jgi:hypothetical protein
MENKSGHELASLWDHSSTITFTDNFVEEYRYLMNGDSATVYYDAEYPTRTDDEASSNKVIYLDSIALTFTNEGAAWTHSRIRNGEKVGTRFLYITDDEAVSFEVTYDSQNRIRKVKSLVSSELFSDISNMLNSEQGQSYRLNYELHYIERENEAIQKKDREMAAIESRIALLEAEPARNNTAINITIDGLQKLLITDHFKEKPHFSIPGVIPLLATLKRQVS